MAFAINIHTESGDEYLFLIDGEPTTKEINEYLKLNLGEEIDYVSSFQYKSTYGIKLYLNTL